MDSDLAHGIGVQNRYALFYDEDVDPLEILRQQEEEKRKKKLEKTLPKDKKPVKTGKGLTTTAAPKKVLDSQPAKTTKIVDSSDVPNKPRGGKTFGDRPPRRDNFHESRENDKNVRNRDDNFFNQERIGDRDAGEFRRGRGGFRGGRGRGGDRGRGYFGDNRPRRMFDRHSGSDKTGVKPIEKRDGGGPNNWGDMRSDLSGRKDESQTWDDEEFDADKSKDQSNWGEDPKEQKEEVTQEDAAADNGEAKENEQTAEEQTQETVKEMTLDEWKKEQETKRMVPKYNLRKPGEGEDQKQWKKSYVLKKKIKDEEEEQDESEEDDEEYQRKNQKILLDFQFNFTDSRRGTRGRGRGGRGGPRGGMGQREDRNIEGRGGRGPPKPRSQQAAPRVDDFNDFPSLVNA